jgi:hypothetical protein
MRLRPTQFLFSLLLLAVLFASDLTAQTTVVRGGGDIFYDPLPAGVFDSLSSNVPTYNSFSPRQNNLTPGENTTNRARFPRA